MKQKLREWIEGDMKRYYGESSLTLKEKLAKPLQVKYLIVYRKASFYGSKSPAGIWYRLRLKRLSEKSGIQIPTKTIIGKGFYIGHFGTVIINPDVVIGENVNIAAGVTIGKTNRGSKMGVPKIGNRVWIGTNAVIVGDITIGDDVLIAPNAYVNTDVPSHSVVLGNPGAIHPRENATEGYINRTV
ncbi:MAG: serine acetyltransferase [Lachnospiraceae bacterium]|nr:serine acetyltransferase [Lachnospiraceae bacterium]